MLSYVAVDCDLLLDLTSSQSTGNEPQGLRMIRHSTHTIWLSIDDILLEEYNSESSKTKVSIELKANQSVHK